LEATVPDRNLHGQTLAVVHSVDLPT
jgi:hypothetical protein